MSRNTGPGTGADVPLLRVVRGDPTAAELAALVAVVARLAAAAAGNRSAQGLTPAAPAWIDRRSMLGADPGHGPGRWRRSGLPS